MHCRRVNGYHEMFFYVGLIGYFEFFGECIDVQEERKYEDDYEMVFMASKFFLIDWIVIVNYAAI